MPCKFGSGICTGVPVWHTSSQNKRAKDGTYIEQGIGESNQKITLSRNIAFTFVLFDHNGILFAFIFQPTAHPTDTFYCKNSAFIIYMPTFIKFS